MSDKDDGIFTDFPSSEEKLCDIDFKNQYRIKIYLIYNLSQKDMVVCLFIVSLSEKPKQNHIKFRKCVMAYTL